MNPDKIEFKNLNKSFQYVKIANEIDSYNDCEELKILQSLFANFITNNKKLSHQWN